MLIRMDGERLSREPMLSYQLDDDECKQSTYSNFKMFFNLFEGFFRGKIQFIVSGVVECILSENIF